MMLKLTYSLARDKFLTVTVLGSPEGIRDLWWQLTQNYSESADGNRIGEIVVSDLDGYVLTKKEIMQHPHGSCTNLSKL